MPDPLKAALMTLSWGVAWALFCILLMEWFA